MELPDGRPTTVPLLPLMLDGQRLGLRHNPPKLDEHGMEIVRGLGYADEEITAMRKDGILRSAAFEVAAPNAAPTP
jgi:crotonobetainyl-CoA:carnitine CoA-transferase CaiB-like acyl-CoA transferase